MSSNAPAQLLGYAIQFPRALVHLLKSGTGDAVSIEVIGDVATHRNDNTVLAEEDKSSTVGNPLTDRSTDLWKTFYNWIVAINNGNIDVEKPHFLLYTNQSGRTSFVNKFDGITEIDDAKKLIDEVKTSFSDITNLHEIWSFYDYVINQHSETFIKLLPKFELQIHSGLGYTEINYELKRMHVPASQIEFISYNLNGWLQKTMLFKILAKEPAIITWDQYHHEFATLFNRAQRLELLDFTLLELPSESVIQQQVKSRPGYLKQLEEIEADDDEIIEAVSDYIRAKVNRDKWIESEIINEEIAEDFEAKLSAFWKNQRKRIELTETSRPECDRGKMLYLDCRSRQETIRDMTPPATTISGTYHLLADGNILGWHPQWSIKSNITE